MRHQAKTIQRKLLAEISVSAVFPALSSGAKSLELRHAQVSQRMKGSFSLSLFCLRDLCLRRKSKSGYGPRELAKVDNTKLLWLQATDIKNPDSFDIYDER